MKNLAFILLAVILFASACSESSSPSNKKLEILPLEIGNKWEYKTSLEGEINDMTAMIFKDTIINNERWFNYGGCLLMINREDGLWLRFYDDITNKWIEELRYKYPAVAGEQYSDSLDFVKVLSVNERITVPAGTFNCYVYRIPLFEDNYMDFYLCPGIGGIKTVSYENWNGHEIYEYQVLQSYSLK